MRKSLRKPGLERNVFNLYQPFMKDPISKLMPNGERVNAFAPRSVTR